MDMRLKSLARRALAVAVALMALPLAAWSHENEAKAAVVSFVESEAFEFSQSAIGRRVGDHRFTDSSGRSVTLTGYAGRPMIVSFVYTSCHHTCPLITRRLMRAVDAARAVFGASGFQVLTVGFDAGVDSPERMRAFARQHRVDDSGWAFLSTDEDTIGAFTSELGFSFFSTPKGFDHLAQTSIIDGEGRVYRQIYGEELEPPDIIEPLKELTFGQRAGKTLLSDWVDGIRLFCTVYDPASGRYRFDYSLIVTAITGIISLGAIAIFLIHGWRQRHASDRSGL